MASEKLFGKSIRPACGYCGVSTGRTERGIVCPRSSGLVSPEHSCNRFTYDPTKRVPPRPLSSGEYSAEDFAI